MDAPDVLIVRNAQVEGIDPRAVRQAVRARVMSIFSDDHGEAEDRTFTASIDGVELDFIVTMVVVGGSNQSVIAIHEHEEEQVEQDSIEFDVIVLDDEPGFFGDVYSPRQMIMSDSGKLRPITDYL